MIPTFIEAFQQQTGQNLQYITTITPQLTSTVTNQPHLVQLQPEGTLVNLVSGVQPTVILPQPRVLSDQIIVDNNGSLVWASQPVQPIFYGFETIVQNTVLQSQQFLPSAVPGVLTANSSYSSTTQVFQTSKLEPILDVASGNIVLLNSNPVVNSQPIQVPQNVPSQLPPPAPLVISENKPAVSWSYLEPHTNSSAVESQSKALPTAPSIPNTVNNSCNTNSISNSSGSSSSSINLPVAPFIPEPGIPTNIVTPTPKPIPSAAQSRPMNRVLPMPTTNSKQNSKTIIKNNITIEKPVTIQKCEKNIDESENLTSKPPKINILEEVVIKPVLEPSVLNEKSKVNEPCPKEETTPLKLVFQKQREGGVYKISNSFNLKNNSSIQIAPLKPIKAKSSVNQTTKLQNSEQNMLEKTVNSTSNNNKPNLKSELKPLQEKQEAAMVYTVETQDGFHYSSTSITDLWTKVFEAVQAARLAHNMPPLPSGSLNMMNNLQILGLKTNGLKYLLEQLPGAGKCTKYKPSFHSQTLEIDTEEDLNIEHIHGASRLIPHTRSHEPSDMFGWLASRHRKPPMFVPNDFEQISRRGSVNNLPMAMRFRHLKLTSKQSVGVYRSKIHKRGLFCHRDIESGEMVIEYAGEVIRSILADKREKQYTAKGMGCYMFRIDENFVVDATMKGNAARFINHSCEPNCYSKVVEILGHKHIIIFALRKILCGEELTYDYKFPFEEDKIPCTCGSRRCRKFLN
ncbi:hypothetical protein ILUMI_22588 [Ignelater luminosus]|uniref:Uncharacterized protein n=1 Tax=Ignelater luminosus TaxID=2038154 RepID=A0A8K0CFJ3_IGNLU|nr:hypothetical protein ILUMI_22588 [Ignelater luminosus]